MLCSYCSLIDCRVVIMISPICTDRPRLVTIFPLFSKEPFITQRHDPKTSVTPLSEIIPHLISFLGFGIKTSSLATTTPPNMYISLDQLSPIFPSERYSLFSTKAKLRKSVAKFQLCELQTMRVSCYVMSCFDGSDRPESMDILIAVHAISIYIGWKEVNQRRSIDRHYVHT